jgi:hypothetical protein
MAVLVAMLSPGRYEVNGPAVVSYVTTLEREVHTTRAGRKRCGGGRWMKGGHKEEL